MAQGHQRQKRLMVQGYQKQKRRIAQGYQRQKRLMVQGHQGQNWNGILKIHIYISKLLNYLLVDKISEKNITILVFIHRN